MSARTLLLFRHDDSTRKVLVEPQNTPAASARTDAGAKPTKPATRRGATWTSERIAQLKSCVEAGLTCSQIAAEIGVTRNAVIGKMSRLGLTGRRKKAMAREAKPQRAIIRTRSLVRILARQRLPSELNSTTSCGAPVPILNGRGCSLFELTPGRCRWPINDPGAADFCFCGSQQVVGLPYCLGHARLAYRATAGSA